MKMFVETTEFSKRYPKFLPGGAYSELEKELVASPRRVM
jgi:hypothetical protein